VKLPLPLGVPGRRLLGGWADDPLWATVYDWVVEHERVGGVLWRLGTDSDLRHLYDAAAEIGRLPTGSRVLDVPCGGGVALRGLVPGQGIEYVAADISPAMLDRTTAAAARRGVLDQVTTVETDLLDLVFDDGEFDLVASFTGLHCVPDPHAGVLELGRVLRPGGVLTGSGLLTDTGLRFEAIRLAGRAAGILGPSCSTAELLTWLTEAGLARVRTESSGAFVYFRAVKAHPAGHRPARG
jgi:SAM-dependent methyltransferase